jgi:hypothetical protein
MEHDKNSISNYSVRIYRNRTFISQIFCEFYGMVKGFI